MLAFHVEHFNDNYVDFNVTSADVVLIMCPPPIENNFAV